MNRMNQTFLKLTPAEKAYEQHQKGERQTGCLLAFSLHIRFLDQCLTYSIAPLFTTLLSISIIPSTNSQVWKIHCTYLLFAVCGESPTIANGAAIDLPEFPVDVDYEITYSCDEGYRFKEGGFNKTIKCEAFGVWSSITNCVGEYFVIREGI